MNLFNSKTKLFLDMSNVKLLARSIVFIDDTLSKLKLQPDQTIQIQIKNPFEPLAQPLVIKSVLKIPVVEKSNNTQFNKEFVCGEYSVIFEAFPPRFQLVQREPKDESQIVKVAKDMVEFADIEKAINKVGINYELFSEEKRDIKDCLLKDHLSKEFTSLSATPVFQIDENTVLNLTIASAENNGKKGVYFRANFDNQITEENSLSKILDKKFRKIADDKINSIFG
jgi:hypothetical protein